VIVSRREVRVEFPTDTAKAWGWSDRKDPGYYPMYRERLVHTACDGRRVVFSYRRPE
jgi:hypothetical protein